MSHTTINTETEPTATIVDPAAPAVDPATPAGELVEDDLLVEDVSIDGMCGVY
jgi:mycofactocin precursor